MKTVFYRKDDGYIVSIYDGNVELSPQMRNEFGSVTVPEDLGSEQNYYKYIPGYKPVSTSTTVESLV